jgi:MFS family permease
MFSRLTFSYLNTSLGYWLTTFLVPLIILDITKSAYIVSISYALNILPYIFITPFSGVFGDLLNRKKIILFGEAVCCFAALGLFFIPYNVATINLIMFIGFIISLFSAVHHPVFQSIIPEIYDEGIIKNVNSQVGMIDSFVSIIAPVSLGLFLAGFDKKYVTLFIFFFYMLSSISIFGIAYSRTTVLVKISTKVILTSLKDGFKYVFKNKKIRNISILFFCMNFGIRMIVTNLIWIFVTVYRIDQSKVSIYFILIGIGAIVGAKCSVFVIGRYKDESIISSCTAVVAICSFLMIFADESLLFSIILSFSSLVQSVIIVTFFTYRQKITEAFILSRVVSVTRLISYLSIPLAAVLSGKMLTNAESVTQVYTISGISIFIGLAIFMLFNRAKTPTLKAKDQM